MQGLYVLKGARIITDSNNVLKFFTLLNTPVWYCLLQIIFKCKFSKTELYTKKILFYIFNLFLYEESLPSRWLYYNFRNALYICAPIENKYFDGCSTRIVPHVSLTYSQSSFICDIKTIIHVHCLPRVSAKLRTNERRGIHECRM